MIGTVVQAHKCSDDQFFYGVVVDVRTDIRPDDPRHLRYRGLETFWEFPQRQYLVRAIKPGDTTPDEWVSEMATYESLRRVFGPIVWIEEWIDSH